VGEKIHSSCPRVRPHRSHAVARGGSRFGTLHNESIASVCEQAVVEPERDDIDGPLGNLTLRSA
jgi:hypothetical protein